jgi:hypothetical protein
VRRGGGRGREVAELYERVGMLEGTVSRKKIRTEKFHLLVGFSIRKKYMDTTAAFVFK